MGEHQQRRWRDPTRLKFLIERRRVGWETEVDSEGRLTRKPVTKPYIIGHGQQLARLRLQHIAAANMVRYAKTPVLAGVSRQVRRRAARP